jgi:O-antigen ligase
LSWRSASSSIRLVGWLLFCAAAPVSIAAAQTGLVVFLGISLLTAPRSRYPDLLRFPLFWVWIIYLITQVIAVFRAGDVGSNWAAMAEDEWVSLALPIVFLNPPNMKQLKLGWSTFVGVAVVMGFYGIYQHFWGWDPIHHLVLARMGTFHRAEGTLGFYLTYGAVQLLAMVLAMSRASEDRIERRYRLLWYGASLILFLSVLATYGRSLWIGMIPVLVWWFVTLSPRWRVIGGSVAVLAIIVMAFLIPELPRRVESIGSSYVNQTRTNLFRTAWRMIEAKPILGHGIRGFDRDFDKYSVEYNYETKCHPHDDSLLVWVQSGIIGLVAFWLMWAVFFALSWCAIRRLIRAPDPERHWMIRAGFWGVMAILIAGFFQCYYIDAEVSEVFWVLLAVTARLSADVVELAGNDRGAVALA